MTPAPSHFINSVAHKNIKSVSDFIKQHEEFTEKEAHRIMYCEDVLRDYSNTALDLISTLIDYIGPTRLTLLDIVSAYEAAKNGVAVTSLECAAYMSKNHSESYFYLSQVEVQGAIKGMTEISAYYRCELLD